MSQLPFKYTLLLENNAPTTFAITCGKWGAGPSKVGLKIKGPDVLAKVFKEEDAQFIVTACNSHHDLLSALKDALQSFQMLPDVEGAYRVTCIQQAKNAIAKAEKKP